MMEFSWCAIIQSEMRSLVIVEPDTLTDCPSDLVKVPEAAVQTIFKFDNACRVH